MRTPFHFKIVSFSINPFVPMKSTVLFLALVLSLAGCNGCNKEENAAASPSTSTGNAAVDALLNNKSVPVKVTLATEEALGEEMLIPGSVSLSAGGEVTVSAQSAGTILYLAPLGKYVSKGEVIARIDAGVQDANLDQALATRDVAKAQLELAEDTYRRQEPLYRDSVISALEFEGIRARRAQAKATLEQAEATVRLAQKGRSNTQVYAPIGGQIERQIATEGAVAAPGTPLAQIVSSGRLRVTGNVSERFSGDIRRGQFVQVKFPSISSERGGTVTFVGSQINATSRTFPIEVEIGRNDGSIKPAMSATIVANRTTADGGVVIPSNAVIRDENGTYVFTVRRESNKTVAMRTYITTGATKGAKIAVKSGLLPGDEVISTGQSGVSEGDEVTIQ